MTDNDGDEERERERERERDGARCTREMEWERRDKGRKRWRKLNCGGGREGWKKK